MVLATTDFAMGDCIFMKLTSITPVGGALSCDPHLIGVCIAYHAYNMYDGS